MSIPGFFGTSARDSSDPCRALKELVSNAYDAGACEVTIKTGWPAIKEIVVTDNGQGMSATEFEHLVKNIGMI